MLSDFAFQSLPVTLQRLFGLSLLLVRRTVGLSLLFLYAWTCCFTALKEQRNVLANKKEKKTKLNKENGLSQQTAALFHIKVGELASERESFTCCGDHKDVSRAVCQPEAQMWTREPGGSTR